MAMAARAVALADELGLRDRVVFFNFGWVPYAERGRYLLEADVARLCALRRYRDPVRLPDATPRLPLGGPAHRHDAGRHARRTDRRGRGRQRGRRWRRRRLGRGARAAARDADDAAAGEAAAAAALRPSLEWPLVVAPLRRLADPDSTSRRHADSVAPPGVEYCWLRLRIGLARNGLPRWRDGSPRVRCRSSGRARRRAGTLGRHGVACPSPLGRARRPSRRLRHNLRILHVIAAMDFKLKYSGSALGYVWSVVEAAGALHDAVPRLRPRSSSWARSRSTTRSRS